MARHKRRENRIGGPYYGRHEKHAMKPFGKAKIARRFGSKGRRHS